MPSAARSRRLPEPFEFFIDRSLGQYTVAQALRARCLPREVVHVHDEHFPDATRDEDWLPQVGRRGWVVLTKDARIRSNDLERGAVLSSGVALFELARGDLTGEQMGELLCGALDRVRTVLRRYRVPIVASVSLRAVTVRIADGVELRPPKEYRQASKTSKPA
jgi:hypothetical protein